MAAQFLDFLASSTSRQRRTLAASTLGWMLDGMDVTLYAMVLRELLRELRLTNAQAGLLASVTLIASAAGGILFGLLADRYGRRTALIISIVFYSIFTAGCGFSHSLWELAAWRLGVGLGMGGEWATGAALVSETWPDQHRGKALGVMQSGFAIGYALAAIIAALIMPRWGWRPVFFAGILPAILTLWIGTRVEESPLWLKRRTRGTGNGTRETGYGTAVTGNGTRDMGDGTRVSGNVTRESAGGIPNSEFDIPDSARGIRNCEFDTPGVGGRIQDSAFDIPDTGGGIQDSAFDPPDAASGIRNSESGIKGLVPKSDDRKSEPANPVSRARYPEPRFLSPVPRGTNPGPRAPSPVSRFPSPVSRSYARAIVVTTLMNSAALFGWWGLFTWIPSYLALPVASGGRGLSLAASSAWIIAMQAGMWLGYVTFGFISDAVGRKRTYTFYLFTAALLVPLYARAQPLALLLVGPLLAFFGTGHFTGFGIITAELFPTSFRATAMGLTYNFGRALSAAAPWAIGVIAVRGELASGFGITGVAFLLAGILALALPETRGRRLA